MKIRRNEVCPCGSGKKYKKCCMHKPASFMDNLPPEPEEQYFGYSTERQPGESPFEIDTKSMCCLVTRLNDHAADSLNHPEQTISFKNGDYIITTGECSSLQLEGPFETAEIAFEFAREKFGAVRFMGKPEFI